MRLLCSFVILSSAFAFAIAPATQRAVNSIQTAVNSVELLPELRKGPIPSAKMQTAKNLLRDLDSALSRGQRALESVPPADSGDENVVELSKTLQEFAAFKADLEKAIDGAAAQSSANDAQFRAFREETKEYAGVVSAFQNGAHGAMSDVKAAVAKLEKLDALCKSKYPGIQDDPKLSFALNISPGTWCDVAARRQTIFDGAIKNAITNSLGGLVAAVGEATHKLAPNHGLINAEGQPYTLLLDRAGGKAALAAKLEPAMKAVGQTMPPDFFKPLDEKLDAFAAEIDRLAPTWTFEANKNDDKTEAAAKKAFASTFKGRSVIKTGMLYADATIAKNGLGIPTERYRTGALLAKGSGKWCEYREFTSHETYSGGGGYAAPHFTFGAMRLQKCQ